jgi:hypothetical protein
MPADNAFEPSASGLMRVRSGTDYRGRQGAIEMIGYVTLGTNNLPRAAE